MTLHGELTISGVLPLHFSSRNPTGVAEPFLYLIADLNGGMFVTSF